MFPEGNSLPRLFEAGFVEPGSGRRPELAERLMPPAKAQSSPI